MSSAEPEAAPPAPIVFIDDDANFLSALRRTLHEMRGRWRMQFFAEASEALEAIRDEPSALIVSDWMMAGMDGLSVCAALRAAEAENGELARYVILLTGRQAAEDQVAALEKGADDFILKPFDRQILIARIGVGLRMLSLQARLREANRRLAEIATTDPLTGAYNRRQGLEILSNELARVQRGQEDLTVILVDLDKFKQINDTHGHVAGDEILKLVVETLRGTCRRYDSVVRWGGDEFVVVCPSADAQQAPEIARRFCAALAEARTESEPGLVLGITGSLGAVTLPGGSRGEIEPIINLADQSLYAIKARGGNGAACAVWTETAARAASA